VENKKYIGCEEKDELDAKYDSKMYTKEIQYSNGYKVTSYTPIFTKEELINLEFRKLLSEYEKILRILENLVFQQNTAKK
jgi:hypothetical protein